MKATTANMTAATTKATTGDGEKPKAGVFCIGRVQKGMVDGSAFCSSLVRVGILCGVAIALLGTGAATEGLPDRARPHSYSLSAASRKDRMKSLSPMKPPPSTTTPTTISTSLSGTEKLRPPGRSNCSS